MRVVDVIAYLRTIERAIVAALAEAGIEARARPDDGPDYTGVWARDHKVASIGVHVARGVTTHGFAINIDNDLEPFSWVVACGLAGVSMTSVRERSAADAAPSTVREAMAEQFAAAFARTPREVSLDRLDAALVVA